MRQKHKSAARVGLALLALMLPACTMLGHEQVAGWPELQIVEHRVNEAQMRDRCAKYVGFGMSPQACAEFYLKARQCHIWLSADFPPPSHIVEHERMHCRGYDHMGQKSMQALLERHVGAQESASAGSSR